MAGDKSGASSLFRRAEQLKRWQESETNRQEYCEKPKNPAVTFSDACIFLAAASAGDQDELIRLLDRGADVNAENPDGITALHAACIDNNLSIAEFLVEAGADINRSDMEGWTPLHATASCGSLTMAKFLIERGSDLALVNNDGNLAVDCVEDQPAMTSLLQKSMLERGVDGKAARSREEKCMLEDIASWMHDGVIEDVPHPKTGATALHVAAAKGYIEVIRLLLEAGVNVNSTDLDGWTPLHAAVHWEQTEAVELLCDSDADLDSINVVGQTPVDLAAPCLRPLLEELKRKQLADRRSRKHKSSPSGRESNKQQRKESHSHARDTENGPKENTATENGKVVNSPSLDASEIQSWRRPSSLRSSKAKEVSATVTGREPLTERSLSSPNHRDTDALHTDRQTNVPAAAPIRRTVSFDRENSNVTTITSSCNNSSSDGAGDSSSFNAATTNNKTSTTTIPPPPKASPTFAESTPPPTPPPKQQQHHPPSPPPVPPPQQQQQQQQQQQATPPPPPPSTLTPTYANTSTNTNSTADTNNTNNSSSNGSSMTSAFAKMSPSSVIKNFFKSFVPPTRDDESETQRKAYARLIRSSRRSTQGVNPDDLKTALYKPATDGGADKVSINDTGAGAASSSPNGTRNSRQEDEERRPSWRLKVDDHDKNKFCLEDVRGKDGSSNGVQIRTKGTEDNKKEEEGEQRGSSGQSREGSQAAIQRRKKPKRRSTGIVSVNMDEIDQERRNMQQQQQQHQDAATNDTNVSERGDSSKGGSSASLATTGSRAASTGPDGDIDYKKLYEEQLGENERLVERLQGYEQDLRGARDTIDAANRANSSKLASAESDRREKRALERKLSEMEEELRQLQKLKAENEKLRAENRALTRVVSKLTSTAALAIK